MNCSLTSRFNFCSIHTVNNTSWSIEGNPVNTWFGWITQNWVWSVTWWVVRCELPLKLFPPVLQWRGFSPVCVTWWAVRFELLLKFFPHIVHWCGFSPVWILRCNLRVPIWVKVFPHWEHWCGFSPVWILWCLLRWCLRLKVFPHWVHGCVFSPVHGIWGPERTELLLKHWSCFSFSCWFSLVSNRCCNFWYEVFVHWERLWCFSSFDFPSMFPLLVGWILWTCPKSSDSHMWC